MLPEQKERRGAKNGAGACLRSREECPRARGNRRRRPRIGVPLREEEMHYGALKWRATAATRHRASLHAGRRETARAAMRAGTRVRGVRRRRPGGGEFPG